MCLNIRTPKNINFPFETNGKLMILGVPILKHFRVSSKPHREPLTEINSSESVTLKVFRGKVFFNPVALRTAKTP